MRFKEYPILKLLIAIIIGIPMYLCNGADILLLRPFMEHLSIPLGTAIAFSMTSTAICVTSTIILFKYIGKMLTLILIVNIFVITLILCVLINLFV